MFGYNFVLTPPHTEVRAAAPTTDAAAAATIRLDPFSLVPGSVSQLSPLAEGRPNGKWRISRAGRGMGQRQRRRRRLACGIKGREGHTDVNGART